CDQYLRVDEAQLPVQQLPADDRTDARRDTSGEEHYACDRRGKMQDVLRKEREEKHPSVQAETEHDEEEERCAQVAVLENPEVDYRMCVGRQVLPHEHCQKADRGDDRERCDRWTLKPVVPVTLFEHILQRPEPNREQTDAQPIDLRGTYLVFRIVQEEVDD